MVTGPRLRLGSVACVKEEKEEELNPLCGAPQCRQTHQVRRRDGTGGSARPRCAWVVRAWCRRDREQGVGGQESLEGRENRGRPARRGRPDDHPQSDRLPPRANTRGLPPLRTVPASHFLLSGPPRSPSPPLSSGLGFREHFRGNVAQKRSPPVRAPHIHTMRHNLRAHSLPK